MSFLLYFFVWKYTLAIYFMGIICISFFSWLNIRFEFYSMIGIINLVIACLIKLF